MKITIQVFDKNSEIASKVFEEGSVRAGRSEFCDIVLPGESISRSHVEFRVTAASVYLTNLSGIGRVKVNGKATETIELADGDEVQVGPYRLVVFFGERENAANLDLKGEPPGDGLPAIAEPAFSPVSSAPEGVALDNGLKPSEEKPAEEGQPAEAGWQSPAADVVSDPPPPEFPVGMSDEAVLPVEGTAALGRAETIIEAKPLVAKLLFTDGPRQGEELLLETFEVTFGRSKKVDIFLDDEKLSRQHAKITRVGMGYRLIDLNSRNGTYVNGVRILEHPLSSFDVIEMGSTKIKFLIHDLVMGDEKRGEIAPLGGTEQTKSLQMEADPPGVVLDFPKRPGSGPPKLFEPSEDLTAKKGRFVRIAAIAIFLLVGALFLLPTGPKGTKPSTSATTSQGKPAANLPPSLPKEYGDLTPEKQRMVEGQYNLALQAAQNENYQEAIAHLKNIHEVLPYYKDSRDLLDQYSREFEKQQNEAAEQKAKSDEKQDLEIYLEDGLNYLKQGEFDRAAEAFNSAIALDPRNELAIKGLKAAEYKVKDISQLPPEEDPESEKKKKVSALFEKAVAAFTNKSYQEAINTAEQIRKIQLKHDTQYLNEAKQIIDRAKMLQKEEFEPFLIQAKEKYAEGDYNASRDLCEEMLKRDAAYGDARECVVKAKKQLNKLAKEAYTHGYILESMNRIEEAKAYWNRAKNFVRPGDDYYDKVMKKLDEYP